jgi:hypothetical protein
LEDSLLLWRGIVSNKLLEGVPIVIFLNKCDLLREKLEAGVQLKNHLITYGDRPNDYESVAKCARGHLVKVVKTTADMHFLDLRNKFGAMHKQHTTNPDRQLFSTYDTQTHGPG